MKALNITAFLAWVGLIALLLYRDYTGTSLGREQALAGAFEKQSYWYEIYQGQRKVGSAHLLYERVGSEIIIRDEREVKIARNGQEKVFTESMKCISDEQYRIKSFEYTSSAGDESSIKVTGEADDEQIVFFIESDKKRKTHTLLLQGRQFFINVTFIPALTQKNPIPNTAFTVPVLDMNSLTITDVKIVAEEIRPVKAGINVLSLYKFRSGDSVWWSTERGIIIKEENPIGLTLFNVPAQFAQDYTEKLISDYTNLPFIKSNLLLSKPDKLTRLKVRVKGYKLEQKLYKNSLATLENDTLVIEKKGASRMSERSYKLPYSGDVFRQYLSPDAWVSSDYKPLHDTGVIYARSNNNDAFLFVQYLTGYVFNIIKTTPKFVLVSAENILKSLTGDYLERTVLFAAYSRAAGLPTRLVGGVVYLRGYFYFHTWPEVWFDEWVPVDPTFYQFPADATHIPLREGTMKDIISIIDDMKSLNIEVLEAS